MTWTASCSSPWARRRLVASAPEGFFIRGLFITEVFYSTSAVGVGASLARLAQGQHFPKISGVRLAFWAGIPTQRNYAFQVGALLPGCVQFAFTVGSWLPGCVQFAFTVGSLMRVGGAMSDVGGLYRRILIRALGINLARPFPVAFPAHPSHQ